MKIYTINTKRVQALVRKVKKTEDCGVKHWREGMDHMDILRFKDQIKEFWNEGNVRYWKKGNSYILTDYSFPWQTFCISKPYFNKYVLPLL